MSSSATSARSPHPAQSHLKVTPIGGYIGAEVGGVRLNGPLAPGVIAAISDALVEHEVIVFRDQDLSFDQLMDFGRCFGELSVNPFTFNLKDKPEGMLIEGSAEKPPQLSDRWHTDESFRREPPMATILSGKVIPPQGGDTVFASMTTAYQGLSERMKRYLHGLEAVHDFKAFRAFFSDSPEARRKLREMEDRFPHIDHPVIRVHPVSGKRVINVNPQFTLRIKGVSDEENDAILRFLYGLTAIPEYQFRVKWRPNTVVMWDNRSTQHYASYDYYPHTRSMERVTIRGDAPVGVAPEYTAQDDGDEVSWLRMRAGSSKVIRHAPGLY